MTVGDKPAIAHVIEKFPPDKEFVIILGYRGDQVREALLAIYPEFHFTFVTVDRYEGKGTGLGLSLQAAKAELQCPFIFIPNDTILGVDRVDLCPAQHGNWLGYYQKVHGDGYQHEAFRTVNISPDGRYITSVNAKGIMNDCLYTGVCGVRDYEDFWRAAENDESFIENGEVAGLNGLSEIKPLQITEWFDCGNLKTLARAKNRFKSPDINVLEKEDETIWFVDDQVVKFSNNMKFISDRILRTRHLPAELFPKLNRSGKYFYTYTREPGVVYADHFTASSLIAFMDICKGETLEGP